MLECMVTAGSSWEGHVKFRDLKSQGMAKLSCYAGDIWETS